MSKSILIADDDRSLRKALAFELTDLGYAVTEAQDGIEAIRLIETQHFDVVICDLIMPKATGMEVFKLAARVRPQTKFISMTGFAEGAEAVAARQILEKNFLIKPFTLEALVGKVEGVLGKG